MGYIIALVVLVVIALLLFPMLAGRRAPKPTKGALGSDHPVSRTEPAADEPNPAASVTASERQQQNAQRRTPPS